MAAGAAPQRARQHVCSSHTSVRFLRMRWRALAPRCVTARELSPNPHPQCSCYCCNAAAAIAPRAALWQRLQRRHSS